MWPIRLERLLIKTQNHIGRARKKGPCLKLSGSKRSARDRWRRSIFSYPEKNRLASALELEARPNSFRAGFSE